MASSTNTTPSQSPNLGSGSASSLPNVNIAPSGSQPAGTSAQPSVAPSPSNIIRQKQGEQAFQRVDKVNGELLALTYGALVSQVIRDLDGNPEEINAQLEKMGYNIGLRLYLNWSLYPFYYLESKSFLLVLVLAAAKILWTQQKCLQKLA